MTDFIVCQVYSEKEGRSVKLEPAEHVTGFPSEEITPLESISEMFDDTGQTKKGIKNQNFLVPDLQHEESTNLLASDFTNYQDPISVPSKSNYKHEESILNEARENLLKAVDSIDLCETQLISLQEVLVDSVKKSALSQILSVKETLGNILLELNLTGQERKIKLEWETNGVKSEVLERNEENLSCDLGVAIKMEDLSEPVDHTNTQETTTGRPKRNRGKAKKYQEEDEDEDFCQVSVPTNTEETVIPKKKGKRGRPGKRKADVADLSGVLVDTNTQEPVISKPTPKHGRPELEDKDFVLKQEEKKARARVQNKERMRIYRKKKKENNEPSAIWSCPHCDKVYYNKGKKLMERHIAKEHAASYPCTQCDAVLKTRHELDLHRRRHRLTICTLCGAEIKTCNVAKHMAHHGERKYKCDQCGSKFFNSHKLKEHIRRHTGEKPYSCEVCGKAFIARRSLLRHKFIHTGEKPYKCNLCKSAFNQKNNLKYHMKGHMKGTIKIDPDFADSEKVDNELIGLEEELS